MTRIEYFDKGLALIGAKIGVVPVEWLVKYDVYKVYLDFVAAGNTKAQAKLLTADQCKCHRSSVERYIAKFENEEIENVSPKKSGKRYSNGNGYWKKWPSNVGYKEA